MSNSHLFFAKTIVIAAYLRTIPDVIEQYNRECRGMALGGEDGRSRVVLSTPEVMRAVGKHFSAKDFRVRFAFGTDDLEYPANMVNPSLMYPRLEVYDGEGKPMGEPIEVSELPEELSVAVEVELMYLMLRSKGVDIPML